MFVTLTLRKTEKEEDKGNVNKLIWIECVLGDSKRD